MRKVVDVEPKRLVLLVKGQLLPRPPTNSHPGVEMHAAPCLLTDVSGRLVFTKDTKMFLIPLSVVEKSKCVFAARPLVDVAYPLSFWGGRMFRISASVVEKSKFLCAARP